MTGADLGAARTFAEAGLSLMFARGARRVETVFRTLSVTGAHGFTRLGPSDRVEVHSGAWWRPWPLRCRKSGSVLLLFGCVLRYS